MTLGLLKRVTGDRFDPECLLRADYAAFRRVELLINVESCKVYIGNIVSEPPFRIAIVIIS